MNVVAIVLTIVGLACIIVAITIAREARRVRRNPAFGSTPVSGIVHGSTGDAPYIGEFKPKHDDEA